MSLELKPLQVDDFSGGITDYYLQGDVKRYQILDNFTINADRKPEMRHGSIGFDENGNHKLPGAPLRVGSFLTFDNGKELLVQQAQKLYYLNPNWSEIVGPSGNKAIGGGGPYDAFTSSPWKDHVYFTSAGGGLPGKLYKDEEGVFQVRTSGLPLPKSIPNYSNSTLLAACLSLANDLRTCMINHMQDATNLHDEVDKWSMSYFVGQTWFPIIDDEYPGPQPAPTPAPNATDEASLFNLVQALNLAYEHHGADGNSSPYYHKEILLGFVIPPKGPYKALSDNTKPTTLAQAATQLNELRQRWTWHRLALFTHSEHNTLSEMDLYPVTVGPISTIDFDGVPSVKSNYSEVFRYVDYLQNAFNAHVSNGQFTSEWYLAQNYTYYHSQRLTQDSWQLCPFSSPTDLDSAYLIVYYIWALYGFVHYTDSNWGTHTNITFDSTADSTNITDVKTTDGTATLNVGNWVIATTDIFYDVDENNRRAAKVMSSGSGTATLSKPLLGTVSDQAAQHSLSVYHGSFVNGALTTITASVVTVDELLEPRPTSGLSDINNNLPVNVENWILRAQETFQALKAHLANGNSHAQQNAIDNYLQLNGPFYLPQVASYGYAFIFSEEYETQDGITYLVQGPPIFMGPVETAKQYPIATELSDGFPVVAGSEPFSVYSRRVESVASAEISNLPVLSNNALTNYATSNVKVEIYRTQDGGNTYYLLGSVDNGTATFTDSVSDNTSSPLEDALDTRSTLYTTGGEVAHDPPPQARFLHLFQNSAYYGYVTDAGETFKNRIIQSIPGAPEAVPPDFYDDVDDEIVGISSTRSSLIVLCRSSVYRMGGGFNNLGQGALTHEKIADAMGCVSSKSIVQTEIGIFYAGTDGFYYTDGYQIIKLSLDIDRTYASFTQTPEQASRIQGSYDKLTRRIWWTVQSQPTAVDCDKAIIFYLNYGVKPAGVFTTASNSTHFSPSALTFFQGEMIRGDSRGLIFRHNAKYKSDPKVPADVSAALSTWGQVYIPWHYRSCALDFGTLYKGNYVTKIHYLGANAGNVNVQVNAIADNNYFAPSAKPLAPMVYRPNLIWGDPNVVWGDSSSQWKYDGKMDQWRRFPRQNLRAQLKQIEFMPARVGIYSYDEAPEGAYCDVVLADLEATLLTPTGFTDLVWPLDVADMVIAFEGDYWTPAGEHVPDGYANEYPIVSVVDEVITFTNPDNALTGDLANQKWVIRGYQKEAGISMLGYVLHFANLGERGESYGRGAGRGENA